MRTIDVAPVADLSKSERIAMLFDHWIDFHETLHAVDHDHAGGGDDDAVTGMPAMYWHPSVVELRRAIGVTRAVMPVNCAHMLAFYEAEWRIAHRTTSRRTKRGKIEVVHGRFRERVVPAGVRRRRVQAAFDHVVLVFRGEVSVPSELLEPIVQAAA